jgi:UDP-glucose 4-epimerase
MDLVDAHVHALDYLVKGGETNIFNLGSGTGYSVAEIIAAARTELDRPAFSPGVAPRRAGDPAVLVASSEKARDVLGWRPARSLADIIGDAAAWHRSELYADTVRAKVSDMERGEHR